MKENHIFLEWLFVVFLGVVFWYHLKEFHDAIIKLIMYQSRVWAAVTQPRVLNGHDHLFPYNTSAVPQRCLTPFLSLGVNLSTGFACTNFHSSPAFILLKIFTSSVKSAESHGHSWIKPPEPTKKFRIICLELTAENSYTAQKCTHSNYWFRTRIEIPENN